MVTFPSVEWFKALGEGVAKDEKEFRRLGYLGDYQLSLGGGSGPRDGGAGA